MSDETPDGAPSDRVDSLSPDEIAKAAAIARQFIAEQDASVTSASVTAHPGTIEQSNTGHPCTSGRVLEIKLIGEFPRIAVLGHPVPTGSPLPDFTVRGMILTADAESGLVCLLTAQTAENGPVEHSPGAAMLPNV